MSPGSPLLLPSSALQRAGAGAMGDITMLWGVEVGLSGFWIFLGGKQGWVVLIRFPPQEGEKLARVASVLARGLTPSNATTHLGYRPCMDAWMLDVAWAAAGMSRMPAMRRGPKATAKKGKGKGWPHGSVGIALSDY